MASSPSSTTATTSREEHLDINHLYAEGLKKPLTMASARQLLRMHFQLYEKFDPENNYMYLFLARQGVGKSSMIRQVCREMDDMPTSRIVCGGAEHEDNLGVPQSTPDGKLTRYTFPPEFPVEAPQRGGRTTGPDGKRVKGCLIVDEMTTANTMQQEQLKQMLTEGKIAFHSIDGMWIPVAAGNPPIRGFTAARRLCKSLMSRIRVRVLEPTSREKLAYWSLKDQFSQTLYKFLIMPAHEHWIKSYEPRWITNTAKMLWQMEQASCSRDFIGQNLGIDMGTTFLIDFTEFLALGENPDNYPVSAREIMESDQRGLSELYARIGKWVSDDKRSSNLTATLDDVFDGWIANGNRLPDDVVDRLSGLIEFMHGDWLRRMFSVCRVAWENGQTDKLLALVEAVKGHPRYEDARVEIEQAMKHINAATKAGARFRPKAVA